MLLASKRRIYDDASISLLERVYGPTPGNGWDRALDLVIRAYLSRSYLIGLNLNVLYCMN